MAQAVLILFAHIYNARACLHQLPHLRHRHLPHSSIEQVQGRQGCLVYHILGSAEYRGITQLQLLQILQGASHGNHGRNDIYPLIRISPSNGLGSQNLSCGIFINQLKVQGSASRHKPHLVRGYDVHRIMGNTGFCGCFFVQSGGRCVQVKDTDRAGPDNPLVIVWYAVHMVRRCPGLSLGRARQRQPGRLMGQLVKHLDGVSHRVDVRVTGPVIVVHLNGPCLPQLQAHSLSQAGLRRNPDGQNGHPRPDLLSRSQCNTLFPNGADAVIYDYIHSMVQQLLLEHLHHIIIKGRHDLVLGLNNRNMPSVHIQILGHFNADKSSAHHCHILNLAVGDEFLQIHNICYIPYRKYVGPVHALYALWTDGTGPRRKDQDVIAFFIDIPGEPVFYPDGFLLPVH